MERDENYPRPQLMRSQWTDLSGAWSFAFDNDNSGLKENWLNRAEKFDRTIIVPFPPESKASGIHDTDPHPIVWYRRTFQLPDVSPEQRCLLHFGAVDYVSQVWVNGHLVAQHQGGNSSFEADITTALNHNQAEQTMVVRVEDSPRDLSQPRGKQDWEDEPHRIWYYRTTGIWQPVWLEFIPDTYIAEIRWTPDVQHGQLGLHLKLNQHPAVPLQVRVKLSIGDTLLAEDVYTLPLSEIQRTLTLQSEKVAMRRDKILWSPGHPNLIDATLTLETDGQTLDKVQSYVGLRSVGFSNGHFLLNGQPYYLRLALEQGYWPDTLLAAPDNAALRREVELAKELGFNGVRIHQKVEDPRFLYWCDRLGLMVWGEMANAYVFSAEAVERFTREWLEVLRRDYNHPCIITWVPLNESWGVPDLEHDPAQRAYVQALYHLTHALDQSRPVIGNDGWEHIVSDIWGIHDYSIDGATLRQRYGSFEALERTFQQLQPHYRLIALPGATRQGEPVMLTECGGISYTPASGTQWWGYVTVGDENSFIEKYRDVISAILASPTISGFCYTQLTDTEQETNGLLTAERVPKFNPAVIREINQQPSASIPAEIIASLQAVAEITSLQKSGT